MSLGAADESFVRNDDEDGLSECGFHEARMLGAHFASMSITGNVALMSSGMRRARETASTIAAALGCRFDVDPRLNELCLRMDPAMTEHEARERQLNAYRSPDEQAARVKVVVASFMQPSTECLRSPTVR
jgi:broad specificity phosphatase PhoE